MGSSESKPSFCQSLAVFTSSLQSVSGEDDGFWESFWSQPVGSAAELFSDVRVEDIRRLRHDCPANLATLCFKVVDKLVRASDVGCTTEQEQNSVVNSVHLLLRVLPFLLEDTEWRCLLWSSPAFCYDHVIPAAPADDAGVAPEHQLVPAQQLVLAVCDLLFCPDFTVVSSHPAACTDNRRYNNTAPFPEQHEDIQSIDSCEFIWAAGVGFTTDPVQCSLHDQHRTLLLKLLLTCFSESIYSPPPADGDDDEDGEGDGVNRWVTFFVSSANRHALPLFTSLLNVVCSYDPVGLGIPYNHVLFGDCREQLVQAALHALTVCLDYGGGSSSQVLDPPAAAAPGASEPADTDVDLPKNTGDSESNLFINYLSRIHREEDFEFILKGFTRLLNNPLQQTLLPHSTKKISFEQELLVLFWKCCDYNKKLLYHVLKSSSVLQVAVPLLYHAHASRSDAGRLGLVHIAVFVLLLFSGERNFGVRLNRTYLGGACMDVPVFSGTHGDLLIVVFHKIITTGHPRLQPLFHCLLTILVNVSPYLKSLSMVSATKLLHLLEAFSTPWFLFCSPNNHHLVFFLLEMFNNIIQYQFDGNSNLVYTIIRKRHVFHALINLPTDAATIDKSLQAKRARSMDVSRSSRKDPGGLLSDSGSLNTTLLNGADSDGWMGSGYTGAHELTMFSVGVDATRSSDCPSLDRSEGSPARTGCTSGYGGGSKSPDSSSPGAEWKATPRWVLSWKNKLPLQTIMRLLQVLVPQVEKICIDKGLTDEGEILRFLQHGTLVGLLPVPHPILIRKYQSNSGTAHWFRTYLWSVIYLRNVDPPIWMGSAVRLFDVQ